MNFSVLFALLAYIIVTAAAPIEPNTTRNSSLPLFRCLLLPQFGNVMILDLRFIF